ncbi:MAG: NB-ARC domain-containing protein [Pseudanabaenaceae cyanobacterium]
MTIEDALFIIDSVLPHKRLSNIQEQLLRHAWEGKNYHEIAEICNYDASYIRDVGYRLWRLLSEAFGERVTKHNFQVVIKKNRHRAILQSQFQAHQDSHLQGGHGVAALASGHGSHLRHESIGINTMAKTGLAAAQGRLSSPNQTYLHDLNAPERDLIGPRCDWGNAIDPTLFYGRTGELATAKRWLLEEGCRLVGILGMGGIGKTAFAIKLAEAVQGEFDYVIWRSLRNAPPAREFLGDVVAFLSGQTVDPVHSPSGSTLDFAPLLQSFSQCLRQSRCLLIWDNFESVLQGGEMTGQYAPGLAEYGEILRQVGETRHQSALILTTREKPKEILPPDNTYGTFSQSLQLNGLGEESAGIFPPSLAADSATADLINYYGGNPLALTVVSRSIMSLYDGDIADFCAQGVGVFSDVRYLLEQQYNRLSDLEKQLMYWLAIEREAINTNELRANLVPPVSKAHVLEALCSLRWRSLIEKGSSGFSQQPIVMEFMTEQLIEQVSNSLIKGDLSLILTYALVKRQAEPYIRQMQIKQIVAPIVQRLVSHFGNRNHHQEGMGVEPGIHHHAPHSSGNHLLGNNLENYLQILQERLSQQYGSFGYGYHNLTVLLQQLRIQSQQMPHQPEVPQEFPNSYLQSSYLQGYLPEVNYLPGANPDHSGLGNSTQFDLVTDIAHA